MQVIHDIKEIFVEAFDITNINRDQTIVEQLVHIVYKFNTKDIEANTKLMDWSFRKYHTKVLEKISKKIVLSQVDLLEKVTSVKTFLENIHKMFTKLCDASFFTIETQHSIRRFQE